MTVADFIDSNVNSGRNPWMEFIVVERELPGFEAGFNPDLNGRFDASKMGKWADRPIIHWDVQIDPQDWDNLLFWLYVDEASFQKGEPMTVDEFVYCNSNPGDLPALEVFVADNAFPELKSQYLPNRSEHFNAKMVNQTIRQWNVEIDQFDLNTVRFCLYVE